MAPHDFLASGSPSDSDSSSRRSSWAALMQEYEDAIEYRSDGARSDTDGDAEVVTKMAQLDIKATDTSPSTGKMADAEFQTVIESTAVAAAVQVSQITIDGNSRASVIDAECPEQLKSERPFHRWMRTIHRRARHRPTLSDEGISPLHENGIHSRTSPWTRTHHRHSSSGSSFAFVAAVRSASASLASVSAVARSRRTTVRSQGFSTTERSSRASISGPRASEDSCVMENRSLADLAAIERSLQRRKVLEELISTEEGYIGDVRFLMNVYVTILAALPSVCVGLRSSINQNLTEIVKLHEELLGELHRVVPHSEYTQADLAPSLSTLPNADCLHTHRRWSSLDAIPEQNVKARWLLKAPGMLSDPQVAAEVSKVFAKKISRFFMYEEYGATYEMMIKDIASAQEAMPDWETYQKGLEALALALGSAKGSEEGTKKALTVNDLLVKTDDGVDGQYFICLLYRDVLCLAAAGKVDPIYTIRACINVDGIRIEDVDNGRGLQCHTAPFSWKLVFECDHQLYEIIMTACNPKEETEWKTRLTRPMSEDQERKSPSMFSTLYMDIKSLGTVFGKQGTLARRISIQRATTVGSAKSPLCQVILKNTNGLRDNSGTASTASTIKRSQSLLTTTTRIPVLAPPRGERARLEALLSDVWTREILPFPGMSMRSRSENLVRSSASTVMRKLSVASFASSFAKKSTAPAQRAQSIENIALETIKRRDMRTPMESMLRDEACMDAEAGRSAKRQRTTKELAGVQAPVHSSRDGPRSLRRRGAWVGKQDLVSDVYSFPSRAASANMLLPSKLTISRAMTSLPETPDRTRKASAERFRSFGRWTRIGVGRNEGTGSFRKLLSIGKEL
ncbi:hypothetical protein A9Z42_0047820 [Trichoderma parareesei]|uniref:DH domain-containing protein n=1 Tax=Trichoderma parareesei TaxID=858221 RepID=A0A2H2ZYJ8_TRIPA|nr:hypothetical protein A9Z42_0047820 [Trichoderma parareesei]